MVRILLTTLLVWSTSASAQGGPDAGTLAAFAAELGHAAGPEWTVQREGETVRLRRSVLLLPMNAASAGDVQRLSYTLAVTVSRYLADAAQRSVLAAQQKRERAAWRAVARLECDGMEFSDHYLDGLCFRARGDRQERRVAAYRAARDRWLAMPRYHRGVEFAVSIRGGGVEPPDGHCEECAALERTVAALLTAYP